MYRLRLWSFVSLLYVCGGQGPLSCYKKELGAITERAKTCDVGDMCATSTVHIRSHELKFKRCLPKSQCEIEEEKIEMGFRVKTTNICCGTNYCNGKALLCYVCEFHKCPTEEKKTCDPGEQCAVTGTYTNGTGLEPPVVSRSCLNATKCGTTEVLNVTRVQRSVRHSCCHKDLCNTE